MDGTEGRNRKTRPISHYGVERRRLSRRLFDTFVLAVQVSTFSLVALAAAIVVAVTAGPHVFPYQTYYVLTGSMDPALPVGTLIISMPAEAAALRAGDVITFQRPDGGDVPVTHRIFAVESTPEGTRFATKGDANPLPDPWRISADARPALVRFAVPELGNVVHLLQYPLARLLIIAIPTLLVGSLMLIEISQVRRRKLPDASVTALEDAGLYARRLS